MRRFHPAFKPFHVRSVGLSLASLTVAAMLAGCQEEAVVNNTHTTRSHISERQSDVCGLTLNRGVLFNTVPAIDPAGPTQVLAGYDTHWAPGAPPFACDRLQLAVGQGVINFDILGLRSRRPALPLPFRGALLEISNFVPIGGDVRVVENEPWGLPAGTGWLGSSGRVRTQCSFKVKAVTENWDAGAAGWRQPQLATRELAEPTHTIITAPLSGVVEINVSAEVGAALASGINGHGFSIEPVGIGMDFKSTSHCAGLFTVRLRTFHGPD